MDHELVRCSYCLEEVVRITGMHRRTVWTIRQHRFIKVPNYKFPTEATLAPNNTETCAYFHVSAPIMEIHSYVPRT